MAIRQHTSRPTRRDEFDTLTPEAIGYQDGSAWLRTLKLAARCLRNRGYAVDEPTRVKATALLPKVLDKSHSYLVGLIGA